MLREWTVYNKHSDLYENATVLSSLTDVASIVIGRRHSSTMMMLLRYRRRRRGRHFAVAVRPEQIISAN